MPPEAPANENNPTPMNPNDFVFWLGGAMDLLSDELPTQEQWAKIRSQVLSQVGAEARRRFESANRPTVPQLRDHARDQARYYLTKNFAKMTDDVAYGVLSTGPSAYGTITTHDAGLAEQAYAPNDRLPHY
jgi:hypothetical protein